MSLQELSATIARPVAETAAGEAKGGDDASPLPAILASHHTPGAAERVNKFCLSAGEIFEAWGNRCHSSQTRRAYRADR